MFIDPHVHCRDGKQAYKETIAHALSVAERAGFSAIFDMPNTDPPITTLEYALERIEIAKKCKSQVWYGTYIALTANKKQIAEAVKAHNEIEEIVGFKLYAGHSVGNIGVIKEVDQQRIYYELARNNYKGVVVVHCEKEKLLKPELWNPTIPVTHALARPPEAEVESLKAQIDFAKYAEFQGTIHIAHISVPQAVQIVNVAKKEIKITCGICPHHILFNLNKMSAHDGLLYKMNPPLRPQGMNDEMLQLLKEGKINWIETDHAPHTLEEKLNKPYMSGIPGLPVYPKFVTWLTHQGFSEELIYHITFSNIKNAFGSKANAIEFHRCIPELKTDSEYQFDPYKHVEF